MEPLPQGINSSLNTFEFSGYCKWNILMLCVYRHLYINIKISLEGQSFFSFYDSFLTETSYVLLEKQNKNCYRFALWEDCIPQWK